MNKVIACLLVALVLLGAALFLLNDRLTPRDSQHQASQTVSDKFPTLPVLPDEKTPPASTGPRSRELPPLPESLELPGTVRAPVIDGAVSIPAEAGPGEPAPAAAPEAPAAASAPAATQDDAGGAPGQEQETVVVADEHFADSPGSPAESGSGAGDADTRAQAAGNGGTVPAAAAGGETSAAKPAVSGQKKEAADRKQRQPQKARPKQCTVMVYKRDGGATVRIEGNAPMTFKQMVLTRPDRVVVDIPGKWEVTTQAIPKNVLVNNVRVGYLPDRGTRVVVDLFAAPRKTRVYQPNGPKQVDVRVDK